MTSCGQSPDRVVDTGRDCGKPIIIFVSDKNKMAMAGVSKDVIDQINDNNDKYAKCMRADW